MITKISNKLNLLTSTSKILVVGNINSIIDDTIDKYFIHKENIEINDQTTDILNFSLYEQFDVIVFSFDKQSFEIYKKDNRDIPHNGIFIISDELYLEFKPFINKVFATLVGEVSEKEFISKIYGVLSINETDNLIKTKEKVVNKYKNDTVNDEINTFLDQYSGNILFINDDLNENLQRLRDLELSHDIFKNLSTSLLQLSNILKQNESLVHLSNMLIDFGKFLEDLDVEQIDPSNFSAFDYLTTIIEDLTIYIDELFVYKLFKNVHIFEDSVENNINYFKMQLLGTDTNEDDDNLEFF